MLPHQAYQAYQDNAVQTATGPELTYMLYNGCVTFIKRAIRELEEADYEKKNINIQKAQQIIRELMLTLDMKIELSKQLMPLYEYMYYRLAEGNIKNNLQYLQEVLDMMTSFRDTWKQAIKNEKQPKTT